MSKEAFLAHFLSDVQSKQTNTQWHHFGSPQPPREACDLFQAELGNMEKTILIKIASTVYKFYFCKH